jgi:transposase
MSKRTVKRKRKTPKKKGSAAAQSGAGRLNVSLDDLKTIIEKTKSVLNEDEIEKLGGVVDTLAVVTRELELKGASVRRLRKLIFGPGSEKMKDVFPDNDTGKSKDDADSKDDSGAEEKKTSAEEDAAKSKNDEEKKPKRKGHGRRGVKEYTGAEKEKIDHASLKAKDNCPECLKGKLYIQKEPATLVRVTGMAPLQAKVYELERLRCNLCGEVFTAKTPDGVGEDKYDNSAAAMIALLKYGCGMPFNRLERLEKDLGIPLPSSTQWEVAYRLALNLAPIYTELIRQAAQGEVLHNDDTTARILNLESPPRVGKNGKERTGLYTSGILSTKDKREIAVFFTGRKHAGENLEHVLSHRNEELGLPIQMCDGISANTVGDFETILSNCNSHARRKFVEIADDFIKETKRILGVFKQVYKNDDDTKKQGMSAQERLEYHIENSKPLLDDLKIWFDKQFEEKTIEPNGSLGLAINYMTVRWEELTLFLRVPGAPLDNNSCERAIKKAILHRKNSMFFKTENGAYVGDLFMSIIHTCELQNQNPFDYLVTLAKHADRISDAPADWMPWNYQTTLAAQDS